MFAVQKNNNLNVYVRGTLSHLFASQFLPSHPDSVLQLKRLDLITQTKKTKKINYLYLWLLTGRRPHSAKFNYSWKHRQFVKMKAKRQRVQVHLSPKHHFRLLNDILWHIIVKQRTSDKQICSYQQLNIQLKMRAVPLTPKTSFLQHSYFPKIPLWLQFRFSYSTAFEKLFFLRALKLFSSEHKFKGLDLFESDYVEY